MHAVSLCRGRGFSQLVFRSLCEVLSTFPQAVSAAGIGSVSLGSLPGMRSRRQAFSILQ